MRRSGRHAADDGSFGRSAGNAALRGGLLLAIAVILGVVLLNAADDNDAFTPVTAGTTAKTTEKKTATTRESATTTTTQVLRPAAQVKVLTANGTSVKGLAGQFKDRLKTAGYNTLAATDTSKKPVATSTVYYVAGYEGEAQAIAQLLGIGATAAMPQPAPVASTQSANVVVVVGNDKAPASSTTTTAKRGTAATTTTTARRSTTTTRG